MKVTIHLGGVVATRMAKWGRRFKTAAEALPDTPTDDWQASRSRAAAAFWNPGVIGPVQ